MGMSCKAECWKIGLLVVAGIAALGWVVMALWNWLLPTMFFGVREIDYVQAMGVLLLSKILFGGFRGHCGGHRKWHRHRVVSQYMENMTPEEREKFQSAILGWCGRGKQADTTSKE
ncbi:MAG: hypothetical protein EPO42_09475 [Gallionellaceae bacterium]|nr:MAG: hypothetical protein EPO42_09475 [Gallionellaceae bacterium]